MATCPICKSEAQEIEPGFFDGETFLWRKDGDFDVADAVLADPALMAAGSDGWEAALKRAANRAAAGRRPAHRYTRLLGLPPQSNARGIAPFSYQLTPDIMSLQPGVR